MCIYTTNHHDSAINPDYTEPDTPWFDPQWTADQRNFPMDQRAVFTSESATEVPA